MSFQTTNTITWYTAPDGEKRFRGPAEIHFDDGSRFVTESVYCTIGGITRMHTEWFIIKPDGSQTRTTEAGLMAFAQEQWKPRRRSFLGWLRGLFA